MVDSSKSLRSLPRFPKQLFNSYYARLLDARDIIIMPMANAWGYFNNKYMFILNLHVIDETKEK